MAFTRNQYPSRDDRIEAVLSLAGNTFTREELGRMTDVMLTKAADMAMDALFPTSRSTIPGAVGDEQDRIAANQRANPEYTWTTKSTIPGQE